MPPGSDEAFEIAEGTGGSGNSEITPLYNALQNKNSDLVQRLQNSKEMLSVEGLKLADQSMELHGKLANEHRDKISIQSNGFKENTSNFGYSSSHMSYQFLPSNQQVSFANTNSGSKKTSEVHNTKSSNLRAGNSTILSHFVPGTEQIAPEAIHVDKYDKKETEPDVESINIDLRPNQLQTHMQKFERPPSCGSLKGCIPEAPFEHRKFSVESLKSRELLPSKNSKNESGKSENSILDRDSVGSNDNHANANEYKSQILIVTDKRDRSESCHAACETPSTSKDKVIEKSKHTTGLGSPAANLSDPRLDAQWLAFTSKQE